MRTKKSASSAEARLPEEERLPAAAIRDNNPVPAEKPMSVLKAVKCRCTAASRAAVFRIILELIATKFAEGDTVNRESLIEKGLLKKSALLVKILGNGDVDKKLTVCADKVSAGAKEKIEKAGGSVSVSGE